jgi:hypothetical protein
MDPRDVCSASDTRCISFVQNQQNQARAVYMSGLSLAYANDLIDGGGRVRSSLLEAPTAVSKTLGPKGGYGLNVGKAGATTFQTQHYAPRLEAAGVSVTKAETAVLNHITPLIDKLTPGASFGGRITVDGVRVEYRAFVFADGRVNIGTLFPVK